MSENKSLVIFDLETTGKNVDKDRIVQFGAVKYPPDLDRSKKETMLMNINPIIRISPEASAVHGITDEDVKDCPKFVEVAKDIEAFIGDSDIGGHNVIAYDIQIIQVEFARANINFDISTRRVFDSLNIFRHILPRTLESTYKFFTGKELGDDAHHALFDSEAAGDVILAQLFEHNVTRDEAHSFSMGNRLTLDGKIRKGDHGHPVMTFGKHEGKSLGRIARYDPGYLEWILKKDFGLEVKNYVRRALNGEFGDKEE